MAKSYGASDIVVLEGIDPVRRRPAMYIGGTDKTGLHHLVWEILDNAIDEAMNGYASQIIVELDKSREGLRISDNGRGIPVDKHPKHKKSALEIIMTTLHAGGKFETGSYIHSGGLHGVGASVVNALSRHLEVQVKRDGKEWEQTYQAGIPQGPVKAKGSAKGTGTSVYFRPDPKIFGKTIQFDPDLLQDSLDAKAYLHKGLKLTFKDGTTGRTHHFHHEQGIQKYLQKLVGDRGKKPTVDFVFYLDRQLPKDSSDSNASSQNLGLELALQWTDEPAEFVKSYVNGVSTPNGGTHEMGLRGGLVKAVRNYIETHNLTPKGLSLQAEDIREGMAAVLSVLVLHPQFQGQTKERLNNTEVQAQVDTIVRPALENYLNENKTIAETLVANNSASALKDIVVAGEQLRVSPEVRALFTTLQDAALHNQYGPSETHVATALTLSKTSDGDENTWPALPSIGHPVANTRCYVLDQAGEPCPIGIPGELYLGGVQVAIGYLNQPELNAENFSPSPFIDGDRLYKTGDRVRFLSDGQIEFLGRADDQVKWRGFRIEPGEIEARLTEQPAVQQAVVLLREDTPGDKRLVAYVTGPGDDNTPDPAALKQVLKDTLPDYMVPSIIVTLDELPLTPSGKVARRRLPAPEYSRDEAVPYVAPRNDTEKTLVAIWADVLGLDSDKQQISIHDDFFELGGHSLLATQLVSRIRDQFGISLPLKYIFRYPSPAELGGTMSALIASSAVNDQADDAEDFEEFSL